MKKYLILFVFALAFVPSLACAGSVQNALKGVIRQRAAAGGAEIISYSTYASAQNLTTEDLVITKPASTAEGDFLIVVVVQDVGTGVLTLPAGWTLLHDLAAASSLTTVAYKVAGASEGADYTFTNTDTYKIGIISRFTKTGGTWNIAGSSEATATGDVTTGEVTCTANSMLIVAMGSDDAGSITGGFPPDMTLIRQESPGSAEAAMWYESRGAGAVTKVVDFTGGGDNVAIAVCVDLI